MRDRLRSLFTTKKKSPTLSKTELGVIKDFYTETPAQVILSDNDIPAPIIYGNLNSMKTLLLMDDQEIVFYLYNNDFNNIKKRYEYDILEHFKVVKCEGPDAGIIASKYINACEDDIVVALLDLTLGNVIRTSKGPILYDGIDIALEIINKYTKCKIGFCTAHMLSEDNPSISELIAKFKHYTGHKLLDYTFSKNEDRPKELYRMIREVEDGDYEDYESRPDLV